MQEGIIYGISVFIGIIAGIGVTLGVDCVKEKKLRVHDRKNLSFEIKCNLTKIDKWLETLSELRNYVNSKRIDQFNGYFDFSSAIFITTNRLFQEGKLYTYLSYDSIEKIQENGSRLSFMGENSINNQIIQHKQSMLNSYQNAIQYAANDIDFWERTLKKCKKNFEDILKDLNL